MLELKLPPAVAPLSEKGKASSCSSLLSSSFSSSEKKDEKIISNRERKLVEQLTLCTRRLQTSGNDLVNEIFLGLAFLQQIRTTRMSTPIVEYWKNISRICFPNNELPEGKIDKKVIELQREALKTFIRQNRSRVSILALTLFDDSSTSSSTSQDSTVLGKAKSATIEAKKSLLDSPDYHDFSTQPERKLFKAQESKEESIEDSIPTKTIFAQAAASFSKESHKPMTETAGTLKTGFWIILETQLIGQLDSLIPSHIEEERQNNIRIAASVISLADFQIKSQGDLCACQRLIFKYDRLSYNMYSIIIRHLTTPENWKVLKLQVPLLAADYNDSIYNFLRRLGESLEHGYLKNLKEILLSSGLCLDKQGNQENSKFQAAVNLVMLARYFAVAVTDDPDASFQAYKNYMKAYNPKVFFLYPDMANAISKHWKSLKAYFISGLRKQSTANLMTFFGAVGSYTKPSRTASAMWQCQNENCEFCSDYCFFSCEV